MKAGKILDRKVVIRKVPNRDIPRISDLIAFFQPIQILGHACGHVLKGCIVTRSP